MSGLFSGFEASVAGMTAERVRMQVIATNIANANNINEHGPYVRRTVRFEEVLGAAGVSATSNEPGGFGRGVRVARVVDDTWNEHPRVPDPGHPYADEQGFVTRPNVNVVNEFVDLMAAKRAYESNLATFSVYRSMVRNAINAIGS